MTLLLSFFVTGCGYHVGAVDRPDASAPDASAPDASAPDASAPDASAPDASAPDASARACAAPSKATAGIYAAELVVEQDGELRPSTSISAGAIVASLAGDEVLRVALISHYDPQPQISDDEVSLILALDLVPQAALGAGGATYAIDQTVDIDPPDLSGPLVTSDAGQVTSAPGSDPFVRRVIVEQACFCGASAEPIHYRVHGSVSIEQLEPHRFRGSVSLDFAGDLTFSGEPHTELHFEGCFDVQEESLSP